ncbi:KTSC domain-containing protein [Sphingomonas gei]|uniref:KTSC domain-containing protein n=2 Tax=Sphingomonas gei TaxID=1395960 RepID=A0A4S1X454_9SPHN|nr:KTSC domain-containing protein [Sphingomonas gei]
MPSTVIRRWDYDEAEQRLDVTFVSGRVYSYHEVPAAVAQAMLEAFSKGSYFNRHIRDHFAFTEHRRRVSP